MTENGQIKFKYIYPDDYNPAYASGAFGVVSSNGDIIINFYLERPSLPKEVVHSVNDNGSLGTEVTVKPEDVKTTFVRYLQSGVILSLDEAENLKNWLSQRIAEASTIKSQIESIKDTKEED